MPGTSFEWVRIPQGEQSPPASPIRTSDEWEIQGKGLICGVQLPRRAVRGRRRRVLRRRWRRSEDAENSFDNTLHHLGLLSRRGGRGRDRVELGKAAHDLVQHELAVRVVRLHLGPLQFRVRDRDIEQHGQNTNVGLERAAELLEARLYLRKTM